ncbi:hypothetical protein TPA0909_15100 [Streptomyces albus]|nr:hypothetical protein TPA0909_15100 [Streptomyces albus]
MLTGQKPDLPSFTAAAPAPVDAPDSPDAPGNGACLVGETTAHTRPPAPAWTGRIAFHRQSGGGARS